MMNNIAKQNYKTFSIYLLFSLFLTVVGSFFGSFLSPSFFIIAAITSIVMIFILILSKKNKILFFIFSLIEGIMLSPLIYHYSNTQLCICLAITFAIVLIFTILGFLFKDLGFLGKFLLVSLFGYLIITIVNIFMPIPFLSIIGIILFSLYIMYDINKFKNKANQTLLDHDIVVDVCNVYLDIINLFLNVLGINVD